jgi:hypothetical protein
MAKKTVLRAFVANKSQVSSCFIQKVTDKIICVIKDEKGTDYHRLSDGTRRTTEKGITQVVDSDAVKAFLESNSLKTWDGGWKPDFNSRGEQVSKKLGSLQEHLSSGGTYQSWFEKAGYEIQELPMSDAIKALLEVSSSSDPADIHPEIVESAETEAEPSSSAPKTEAKPKAKKGTKQAKSKAKGTKQAKSKLESPAEDTTQPSTDDFEDDFTD